MAFLLGAGSFPAMAQPGPVIGYVFGVHGRWSASDPYVPELKLGQSVRAGQVIQLVDKSDHCFMSIGYVNNTATVLDCDRDPKGCQAPLDVPPIAVDSTMMKRLGAAWSRLFSHGPVPVVFALARGAAKGPQEAVLSLDQDRLNPANALRDIDAGDYTLTLRPLPESGAAPIRLRCNWKPQPPSAQCLAEPRLAAGLFALSVSSASGPVGSPVAVLLTSPARLDALARVFDEWKSVTRSWPKDTPLETVHYFRTAGLDALNQTAQLP
jgi:hypothetical protein